jgi:ketosteroid isomerase-like protein
LEFENHAVTARALFDAFLGRHRADFEALITDDFTFTSPYDDHIDRGAYFERCWPNAEHFTNFEIERVSADQDGAFVTYLCTTKDGKSFRNTEYIAVKDERVVSVDVYFGATYRDGKFMAQADEE